jgi:hypothetical protein
LSGAVVFTYYVGRNPLSVVGMELDGRQVHQA